MHETDAWNFCYMLPAEPYEPIYIVVPTSLQMGWYKSPAFFCTASKMARDIAQELLEGNTELTPHPLENLCMPTTNTFPNINESTHKKLIQLLEVYVDDFVGLLQSPTLSQAQKFTR